MLHRLHSHLLLPIQVLGQVGEGPTVLALTFHCRSFFKNKISLQITHRLTLVAYPPVDA